mmetsp:Transcript_11961/g.18059  ORF Transcript_11961/g.18059 Transcript_11961/m.18059 type:complete len:240 (-) Transcript_11961:222-941(-)
MSLSFVKSAVLSSTDGISHNEETTINTSETASIRASSTNSASHKPLFEQLRANKEIQDAKDDEFQKSIRGMQALDDEDVAHLDAIEEQKREVEYKVKSGIEREVALFHAAREDRGLVQTVIEDQVGGDDGDGDGGDISNDDRGHKKSQSSGGDQILAAAAVPAAKKPIVPKFTIKKKRKRVDAESKDDAAPKKISGTTELKKSNNDDGEKQQAEEEKPKNNNVADLLGLGCYGSDSDSD